jgi:hypothetical protein
VIGERTRLGVVETGRAAGAAVLATELDHRGVAEAVFRWSNTQEVVQGCTTERAFLSLYREYGIISGLR